MAGCCREECRDTTELQTPPTLLTSTRSILVGSRLLGLQSFGSLVNPARFKYFTEIFAQRGRSPHCDLAGIERKRWETWMILICLLSAKGGKNWWSCGRQECNMLPPVSCLLSPVCSKICLTQTIANLADSAILKIITMELFLKLMTKFSIHFNTNWLSVRFLRQITKSQTIELLHISHLLWLRPLNVQRIIIFQSNNIYWTKRTLYGEGWWWLSIWNLNSKIKDVDI